MSRPSPQSYLLRLWRTHEATPLRATLIAVAQPEAPPRHFASLAALYAFLGELAGETTGTTRESNDTHCTVPEID
jgi:hypothetical protein